VGGPEQSGDEEKFYRKIAKGASYQKGRRFRTACASVFAHLLCNRTTGQSLPPRRRISTALSAPALPVEPTVISSVNPPSESGIHTLSIKRCGPGGLTREEKTAQTSAPR
jgi:hypothetical protein